FVGLGALAMVGVILSANTPLHALVAAIKERSKLPAPAPAPVRPSRLQREPIARRAVVETPTPERVTTEGPPADRKTRQAPSQKNTQPAKAPTNVTPPSKTATSTPKEGYELPPLTLLAEPANKAKRSPQEMQRNIETLEGTLEEFGIDAN